MILDDMTTLELCEQLVSPQSDCGKGDSPDQKAIGMALHKAIGMALGRKMLAAGLRCIYQNLGNITHLVLLNRLGRAYIPVTATCSRVDEILGDQDAAAFREPGYAVGDRVEFVGSDGMAAEGFVLGIDGTVTHGVCIIYADPERRHVHTYRRPSEVRRLDAARVDDERSTTGGPWDAVMRKIADSEWKTIVSKRAAADAAAGVDR